MKRFVSDDKFTIFLTNKVKGMKTFIKVTGMAVVGLVTLLPLKAQDKFEVSGGVDLVSNYVWRGMDQASGASFQPALGLSYKGVSLGAWGSSSITDLDPQEFDITLGYSTGGFGISITDYWWAGTDAPYGHYKDSHFFEGTISYNFGEKCPLTLSWSTMFAGGDKDESGDRYYSSYFSAAYDISLPKEITLTPAIGINPYKSMYDKDFNVMDISLKAAKDIKITDNFAIPLFVQAIVSPACDHTYLVAGFNVGF